MKRDRGIFTMNSPCRWEELPQTELWEQQQKEPAP